MINASLFSGDPVMADQKSSNPLTRRYLLADDGIGHELRARDLLQGLASRRVCATQQLRPLSGGAWRSVSEDPELGPAARIVLSETQARWSPRGCVLGMLRAGLPLFVPLVLLLPCCYLQLRPARFLASWRVLLPASLSCYLALACWYRFWSQYLPGRRRHGAFFCFLLPYVNLWALWLYFRDLLRPLPARQAALPQALLLCCCASLAFFQGVLLLAPPQLVGGLWALGASGLFVLALSLFNVALCRLTRERARELDADFPLVAEEVQSGDAAAPLSRAWRLLGARRRSYRLLSLVCALPLAALLLLGPAWAGGCWRWRQLRQHYAALPLDMQDYATLPLPEEPHAGTRMLRIRIADFDLGLVNHQQLLYADIIRGSEGQWLEKAKARYQRLAAPLLAFRALLREAPHLGLLRPQLGVVRQGRDSVELVRDKAREYVHWRLFAFRFATLLGLNEEARPEALWEDFVRISDYEQDDLIRPLAVATNSYSQRLSLLQAILPALAEESLPTLLPPLAADEARIDHAARWQCLAENALFADVYLALARAAWDKAALFGLDHGTRAELFVHYARLMELLEQDLQQSRAEITKLQGRASRYGGLHFGVAQQAAGFMAMARQTAAARLDSRLAHVAVAIERHRRRHGEWPADLTALPEEFLDELPLNPFDGQQLNYERGLISVEVMELRLEEQELRALPSREQRPGAKLWAVDEQGSEHEIKFF
jgi:hypothetical protein